jgi:UDP-glucose 4-epimerase
MSVKNQQPTLVTGSNGFIGKHLFSHLCNQNLMVHECTRNNKEGISFLKKTSISRYCLTNKISTIVHLASMVKKIKSDHDISNEINMGINLISSLKPGSKFIYFSSADVYKKNSALLCEKSPVSPISYYARAKIETEASIQEIADKNDIELIILRPSLVYGSGTPNGMFLSDLKNSKKYGTRFSYSSNHIIRDFIHVSDVTKAVAKIIQHNKNIGGIYNLSTGVGNSLSGIVEMAKEKSEHNFLVTRDSHKSAPSTLILNPNKLKKTIKWQPLIAIEDGLKVFLNE